MGMRHYILVALASKINYFLSDPVEHLTSNFFFCHYILYYTFVPRLAASTRLY